MRTCSFLFHHAFLAGFFSVFYFINRPLALASQEFIKRKRPIAIAIGCEGMQTMNVMRDINRHASE